MIGFGSVMVFFSSMDDDPSGREFGQWIASSGTGLFTFYLLFWIGLIPVLAVLVDIYVRNMEFVILDNDIIVKKGIINKEVKHIPFRTITNVSSRFGVYDRMFGIGTFQIETAGKSGHLSGPEAKIEGIQNYFEVRDVILNMIRKFRGQYATITEIEPTKPTPITKQGFHREMLVELREIKRILTK